MPIYTLDPLTDPRWEPFLDLHPQASLFHSKAWLQALYDTYGYQPSAQTEAAPEQPLQNALLSCRVKSWLTGQRSVATPFSDFCDPLVTGHKEVQGLLSAASQSSIQAKDQYFELRTTQNWVLPALFGNTAVYFWHRLDLSPSIDALYQNFHKNHVKRKIRRAEKEGLRYEVGSSKALLKQFYDLFLFNRRKHKVPPQPFEWFENLLKQFQEQMQIHIAYHQEQPIAAIITFNYGDVCYYKYGSSDPAYTSMGSNALLFWQAIQAAKQANLQGFDMGRSDINPAGFNLAKFKENWGAKRQAVHYWRSDVQTTAHEPPLTLPEEAQIEPESRLRRFAHALVARLPNKLLVLSGRLLYRHMG